MMSNYVLLIERQNGVSLEDVEKYLKTEFRSEDYMMGFLDGYLFDKYQVLTLKEYESIFFSKLTFNHGIKRVVLINIKITC